MADTDAIHTGPDYALAPAAVADENDEEAIAQARKSSHDYVIQMAGSRRTSGVQWLEWDAPNGIRVIENHLDDGRPQWASYKRFLADNPKGLLIVAMVECAGAGS